MFNRALYLFLLFSHCPILPAGYVSLVVEGVKNIVIPAIAAVASGQNSISKRSRDAFFIECQMENRGMAKGVQGSAARGSYSLSSTIDMPTHSPAGIPLYENGVPTEEYFKDLARRSDEYNRQQKKDLEGASNQNENDVSKQYSDARQKEIKANVAKARREWHEKAELSKQSKAIHPTTEGIIKRSQQPKELKDLNKTNKLDEKKQGDPDKGKKDPEKDLGIDPTKQRRTKASDLPHDNPAPDPRTTGMTENDLIFPSEQTHPAQYFHLFASRMGHIQKLTDKARETLKNCFKNGRFLNQDKTGAFNFDWVDPETGHQLWLRIRPDGKVIDCGANVVHWGLNKNGLSEKPWDLSRESKTGIAIAAATMNTQSLEARAEEAKREKEPSHQEIRDFVESHIPSMKENRLKEEEKKREVAQEFARNEFDRVQEKVRNSRLSKLSANAMIEIAPPESSRSSEIKEKSSESPSIGLYSGSGFSKSVSVPMMPFKMTVLPDNMKNSWDDPDDDPFDDFDDDDEEDNGDDYGSVGWN